MFALSGQGVLEECYRKAGFRDVAVRAVPVQRHFPSTAEAVRAMKDSFPRLQSAHGQAERHRPRAGLE